MHFQFPLPYTDYSLSTRLDAMKDGIDVMTFWLHRKFEKRK